MLTKISSFSEVQEHTQNWSQEVRRSNFLRDKLLEIEGSTVLSEYPGKHALSKIDTTGN